MKISTRDLIITALFTTLTIVGASISIPFGPVPITLQTLFVILSGIILGAKLGALSQITYVALGLLGLPIFAGGSGGLTTVLKPSFGFILSFIVASYIVGKLTEKDRNIKRIVLSVIVANLVIYIIGLPYFYFIFTNYLGKSISFYSVLKFAFIPFIPGDILKALISIILAKQLIPKIGRTKSYINKNDSSLY